MAGAAIGAKTANYSDDPRYYLKSQLWQNVRMKIRTTTIKKKQKTKILPGLGRFRAAWWSASVPPGAPRLAQDVL